MDLEFLLSQLPRKNTGPKLLARNYINIQVTPYFKSICCVSNVAPHSQFFLCPLMQEPLLTSSDVALLKGKHSLDTLSAAKRSTVKCFLDTLRNVRLKAIIKVLV